MPQNNDVAVPTPAPAKKAPVRHYRCVNQKCFLTEMKRSRSGFYDFTLDAQAPPACPKCGHTPDHAFLPLMRLAIVHFNPPFDEYNTVGKGYRACNPAVKIQVKANPDGSTEIGNAGTGVPSAVTCAACKESDEFKTALARWEGD